MKKKFNFIFAIFYFSIFCNFISVKAQNTNFNKNSESDTTIFVFVDESPSFIGDETALNQYITSNLKYPENARKLDIQGTVYVTFIIEKDGSITKRKF